MEEQKSRRLTMEEQKSTTALTSEVTKNEEEQTWMSRMKKGLLYFKPSLQESFSYVKARFMGLAKMATARNENEAAEADLKMQKMQVEAADHAEETKKKLENDSD